MTKEVKLYLSHTNVNGPVKSTYQQQDMIDILGEECVEKLLSDELSMAPNKQGYYVQSTVASQMIRELNLHEEAVGYLELLVDTGKLLMKVKVTRQTKTLKFAPLAGAKYSTVECAMYSLGIFNVGVQIGNKAEG